RRALERAVGVEIGLAQTEVDVVAALRTNEFLQQVEFFEGRMWRSQRTDALARFAQAVDHMLQRHRPVDLAPLAALLHHRTLETLIVQAFVGRSEEHT